MNFYAYLFLCLVLLLTNSTMIVFVVMEGDKLVNFQYSFAFALAAITSLVYYVWCVLGRIVDNSRFRFTYLNPLQPVENEVGHLHHFQITGIIGLCLAMNYVFLLIANPYTSGVIQVIFNELNIVVSMIGSMLLLGKSYQWLQLFAGLVCVVGGIIPLAVPSPSPAQSSIPTLVWYLIYLLGTTPIPFSYIVTENLLQIGFKSHIEAQIKEEEDFGIQNEKQVTRKQVRISQMYCLANMWTTVFVLAFFWVAGIAYVDNLWSNFTNGLACIFSFGAYNPTECSGVEWVWVAMLSSFFSTWSSAMITREEDVTIATLIMTVAPFLSSVIMGVKQIFGPYYTPINWTGWVSLAIVALSVVLYKIPNFFGKGISYPRRNILLSIQEPVFQSLKPQDTL